jgi:DNA-binding transcriptional regulator YhcF (GntR family)
MIRYGAVMADSRWPKTALLVQEIRGLIRGGQIGPGERVPSENELARDHGVATDTANRALGILRDEGLVSSRRGIGSIAAAAEPARLVRLAAGASVTARIPTPAEQAGAGAGEWEPVLVVAEPGQPERLYPASQVILITPGGSA